MQRIQVQRIENVYVSEDLGMDSKWLYIAGLCVAAALWGFNFGISRLGMDTFDPQLFVFLRFGIAVPFFFLILKLKEGYIGIHLKDVGVLLIVGFVGVTLLEMIVMYSIEHTTLANASLLNVAPWPIFVALFSPLFMKENITSRVIIGGAIAMLGVSLVILGGKEGINLSSSHILGNLAALSVSILGALMNLGCMQLMKKYSALRVTTWQIMFGVIFLFPFTLDSWQKVSWLSLSSLEFGIIGYNVVFCTIIAFILWNSCMYRIGATSSNFFRYVVPVAAVVSGFVMYDERLQIWQLLGAICMVVGLVWISMERKVDSQTTSYV